MGEYAKGTTVPAEKTRGEIEATLRRYRADSFLSGWDGPRAFIAFRLADRFIKFTMALPDRSDKRFWFTPQRVERRSDKAAQDAYEQAVRAAWRALLLVIKAKLESVSSGIETIEEAFLAQIVLPDGSTMGQWAGPQIQRAYDTKQMPASILALPPGKADTPSENLRVVNGDDD
jgi:hypothetical protein